MPTEQRREEHVADRVFRVVVAHRDFLKHHVAFKLDVSGRADAVEHDIGHQIDRQFEVRVEDVRVIAGVLLGRKRVQLATDRIDCLRDTHCRARRRRLEQQVLEEVRGAGNCGSFISGPDADPETDRRGTHRRNPFGDDAKTAGKRRAAQRGCRVTSAHPAP